jgi:hypothetical protein
VTGKKKQRVRCTVRFSVGAGASSASVRLSRAGVTVARGSASLSGGRAAVRLRSPLPPGRYSLTIRVTDAAGSTTAASRRIRVG